MPATRSYLGSWHEHRGMALRGVATSNPLVSKGNRIETTTGFSIGPALGTIRHRAVASSLARRDR